MNDEQKSITLLYNEACCNNPEALRFILLWHAYVHGIDDIIDAEVDGKKREPEEIIGTFVHANIIFTCPFYLQHHRELQAVMFIVANAYADSVAWAKSTDDGLLKMADVLRFAGNEMLFAVAAICGGYSHMRSISERVRKNSWNTHHAVNGEPH